MSRQVTVVTPENIPLTLELAGLGTRFGALLLDALWQLMVGTALLMIAGLLALFASAYMQPLLPFVPALLILGTFVIVFGYFIFFETIWNGQTPGKKAFGLRVVRDGGYPVGFFASAARNFVRIADFLPVFYGVGSISMFFNGEYKRLGDFVAGTIVIKERAAPAALTPLPKSVPVSPQAVLPAHAADPYEVLTGSELTVLRRFAVRRWQMLPDDAERLAYRLVVPLVPRLQITFLPGVAPRYADLISTVVAVADKNAEEKRDV